MLRKGKNLSIILIIILSIFLVLLLCNFAYQKGLDDGRIARMEEEVQLRK